MTEIKLKILAKKSDNKAFKGSDDSWYNLNDNVVPYLEKMNKGDEVVVTFEKKGVSRYVSKLTGSGTVESGTETTSTTGFVCEVCGKALKDDKFKKCFMCNKTGAVKKEDPKSNPSEITSTPSVKKEYKSYDNPEKTAQIQRGNALNASAAVASGCGFSDPETAKQFTLELADAFLDWLRAE